MRKKITALASLAVLAVATTGAAAASSAAEPAKAYGVCVHKSNGAMRMLERNNLPKSRYGKCKSTERKVTLPSVDGVPKLPSTLVFQRAAGSETCTRTAASTATTLVFSCVVETPTPSPSAS